MDVPDTRSPYYIENGLRKVVPYVYTFTVNAKGRWVGKPLVDILVSEFRAYDKPYYESAIKVGTILINNKKAASNYLLRDRDLISHQTHRHEPPVVGEPIEVAYEDDQVIVVSKPGSIPIHPGGNYRHNTTQFVLQYDRKLPDLHIIHRLDAMTSGLLLLGKQKEVSARLCQEIKDHDVMKQYFALVHGIFPFHIKFVDQPILRDFPSRGLMGVKEGGKEAQTLFYCLGHDTSNSVSLLKCRPYTGRTHQIRVHLQWLGFPIVQDPLYTLNPEEHPQHVVNTPPTKKPDDQNSKEGEEEEGMDLMGFMKKNCPYCLNPEPEPTPNQLFLCLHAHSYQSADWKYTTKPPPWACGILESAQDFDLSVFPNAASAVPTSPGYLEYSSPEK